MPSVSTLALVFTARKPADEAPFDHGRQQIKLLADWR
jgi:hypothetical protein